MGADPKPLGPTREELQFDIDRRRREIEQFGVGGIVPQPGFTTVGRRGGLRGGSGKTVRSTIVSPQGKFRIHGGFSTADEILGTSAGRGRFNRRKAIVGTGTGIGSPGFRGFTSR